MKRFKLLFLLGIGGLLINSCTTNLPDPDDLMGRWKLVSIESQIDESTADPLSKSKVYEGNLLYFDFRGNGIFSTNTDLGLNQLLLSEGPSSPGNYKYSESGGRVYVEISVVDPQLQSVITLYFEAIELNTQNPKLYMNKDNYIKSLRESAKKMNAQFSTSINSFSNRINQAWFSLSFEKL